MSQNGKGSKPRPLSISYTEYSDRYDYIFRKKETKHKEQDDKNRPKVQKGNQTAAK